MAVVSYLSGQCDVGIPTDRHAAAQIPAQGDGSGTGPPACGCRVTGGALVSGGVDAWEVDVCAAVETDAADGSSSLQRGGRRGVSAQRGCNRSGAEVAGAVAFDDSAGGVGVGSVVSCGHRAVDSRVRAADRTRDVGERGLDGGLQQPDVIVALADVVGAGGVCHHQTVDVTTGFKCH